MTEATAETTDAPALFRANTYHRRTVRFTGGPVLESRDRKRFIADVLEYQWTDNREPGGYYVSGQRLKKDGRPGELRGRIQYRPDEVEDPDVDRRQPLPDWLRKLMKEADDAE